MNIPDFGIRSVPPRRDCYEDGHCSMNCSGPGDRVGPDPADNMECAACHGNTYVTRDFGEIACPECMPDAYAEQINDIWQGY